MALSDLAVELVLKAKNLISPSTDAAADSVGHLSAEAAALRDTLDQLEDQRALVRAFQQATTATGKAQKEWDKATDKVRALEQEIEASGQASIAQQNRLNEARAVAARVGAAAAGGALVGGVVRTCQGDAQVGAMVYVEDDQIIGVASSLLVVVIEV